MARSKRQRRTKPAAHLPAHADVHTVCQRLARQRRARVDIRAVEREEGASAAHVEQDGGITRAELLQARVENVAAVLGALAEVLLLSGVDDSGELNRAHGIAHPSVEHLIREGGSEVRLVVETTRQHLLAEGDDVGRIVKLPRLVSPHVAGGIPA